MDDFLGNRSVVSHGNPMTPAQPVDASPLLGQFFGGFEEQATTLCEASGRRPQVEMVTRDGVVTKIRLVFADGEVLELDCVYPEAG